MAPKNLPPQHGCVGQRWVYANEENPLNYHDFSDSKETSPYNFLMTYHSTADIPLYYGYFIPHEREKWYVKNIL